ncbi:hypothetical protein CERZMDRAFT_110558 [Cercospora zeae-maydis SCOH1-5]|uniref:Uncharacterized protein n=1 Tax=Cercospora zeae-maydis SCOH1-5 TaxID=717836 RepID=A0A6A6FNY8_9PEZI|nr:hypothetical protein CERZMDRAFT_110558 [Cercospora zeae-maydis SCOH1-5]
MTRSKTQESLIATTLNIPQSKEPPLTLTKRTNKPIIRDDLGHLITDHSNLIPPNAHHHSPRRPQTSSSPQTTTAQA